MFKKFKGIEFWTSSNLEDSSEKHILPLVNFLNYRVLGMAFALLYLKYLRFQINFYKNSTKQKEIYVNHIFKNNPPRPNLPKAMASEVVKVTAEVNQPTQ